MADFNNDGLDLAALNNLECLTVARGRGDLTFEEADHYLISPSSKIFTGDFNRDNKIDKKSRPDFQSREKRIGQNA